MSDEPDFELDAALEIAQRELDAMALWEQHNGGRYPDIESRLGANDLRVLASAFLKLLEQHEAGTTAKDEV